MKYFIIFSILLFSSNVFADSYQFKCVHKKHNVVDGVDKHLRYTYTYRVEQNSDVIQRHYIIELKDINTDEYSEVSFEEGGVLSAVWTVDQLIVKSGNYNEIISRNDLSLNVVGFTLEFKSKCSMEKIGTKRQF